jgi:hypothetical protein
MFTKVTMVSKATVAAMVIFVKNFTNVHEPEGTKDNRKKMFT